MSGQRLYGMVAEFTRAAQLLEAVRRTRAHAPAAAIEAYSPFPIEGLAEALEMRGDRVPLVMLLGAIAGGAGTYALEWYSAVINYPLDIGGRPLDSWPAFLPAAIEMTILGAALAGLIAMLAGSGLPRLHHPLFAVPAFERASKDRFFLLWRADGPGFDAGAAGAFLETLAPRSISEVRA